MQRASRAHLDRRLEVGARDGDLRDGRRLSSLHRLDPCRFIDLTSLDEEDPDGEAMKPWPEPSALGAALAPASEEVAQAQAQLEQALEAAGLSRRSDDEDEDEDEDGDQI